jgi:putative permease
MDITVGKFLRFITFVFIITLIGWLLYKLSTIVTILVIAALIAYILDPIASYLEAKGISRTFATSIIFIIVFLVFAMIIWLFVPGLLDQLIDLQNSVSVDTENSIITSVENFIKNNIKIINVEALNLRQKINSTLDLLAYELLSILGNIISIVPIILIVPFIVFFLLKDGRMMKKQFIQYLPNRYFEMALNVLHKIDMQLGSYIRGQFIEATVVAILSVIALWFLNVKYFTVIGVFAGLANMIPYVGPVAGAVPALIVTWLNGGVLPDLVYIVIAFALIQLIDNILLQPMVLSRSVNLHPLVIVMAILIGGQFFGLLGMLLAVPAAGVLKVTSRELYNGIRKFRLL